MKKYQMIGTAIVYKIGKKNYIVAWGSSPFFVDELNKAYELGRQDEFKDNIKKTNKLMRKYPILRKAAL